MGHVDAQVVGLGLDHGHAGLQVGGLDVCQQTALEPGLQTVGQGGDLLGRTVRGEDDLPVGLKQRLKGVEELFLQLYLAAQKLHIVHQQKVRLAVLGPEFGKAGLQRVHQLVHKVFAFDVDDAEVGVLFADGTGDGEQKMGLSQAGAAVNEQRVV